MKSALDVCLLVALGVFLVAGMTAAPFHGDEATFIAMSRDYDVLVHEHAPRELVLQEAPADPVLQFLRIQNGSLHPLTIGLARDLAGLPPSELNRVWNWDIVPPGDPAQWQRNIEEGRMPSARLLRVARIPSTLLTVLAFALLFRIARSVSGSRAAAWIATFFFATTPAVLLNGRRAMQEGALFFCSALVIVIALRAVRACLEDARGRLPWLAALGVAAGLAEAAKLTSIAVSGAAFLTLIVLPLLPGSARKLGLRYAAGVVGSGLLAVLVFVLLMPVWWAAAQILVLLAATLCAFTVAAVRRRALAAALGAVAALLLITALAAKPMVLSELARWPGLVLRGRNWVMEVQTRKLGEQGTLVARVATLAAQSFFAAPQYYEDPAWGRLDGVGYAIDAYERSGLAGRTGSLWAVPGLALAVGGLVALALQLAEPRRRGGALLVGFWLGAVVLSLLANPLPWQRYYLMLQPPLAVLIALGSEPIVAWIAARARRKSAA